MAHTTFHEPFHWGISIWERSGLERKQTKMKNKWHGMTATHVKYHKFPKYLDTQKKML